MAYSAAVIALIVNGLPGISTLLESVIEGMINTKLIGDARQVASVWSTRIEHSYPTPTLSRDEVIMSVLPELDRMGISSRGRFGAWRYEVGNQDHCLMQGVEWVNHVMRGEEEVTVWHPEKVNGPRPPKAAGA